MLSEAAGRDGMSEWEADVFFTFPNNVDVSNERGENRSVLL